MQHKRLQIDLLKDKIVKKYKNENHIEDILLCINEKWNPMRNDSWGQGFDDECGFHCRCSDICNEVFNDESCQGKNHFKIITVNIDDNTNMKAHWIEHRSPTGSYGECSKCGNQDEYFGDYCSDCGFKMDEIVRNSK